LLDQMFTGDNFRRIYDRENRRGNDLAGKFFPNLDPLTQAIRHKVADIRNLRADKTLLAPSAFSAAWSSLKYELRNLKAKKSQAIIQTDANAKLGAEGQVCLQRRRNPGSILREQTASRERSKNLPSKAGEQTPSRFSTAGHHQLSVPIRASSN
jgi:hypothetical protein